MPAAVVLRVPARSAISGLTLFSRFMGAIEGSALPGGGRASKTVRGDNDSPAERLPLGRPLLLQCRASAPLLKGAPPPAARRLRRWPSGPPLTRGAPARGRSERAAGGKRGPGGGGWAPDYLGPGLGARQVGWGAWSAKRPAGSGWVGTVGGRFLTPRGYVVRHGADIWQ